MRNARPWPLVVFLMIVSLGARPSHALAQAGMSSVSGEVRDQLAAAIPGATVTLVHAATQAERVVATDRTGAYRILALAPGTYQLRVEFPGFAAAVRDGVALAVDTATRLDPIVLTVGGVKESVDVQASAASSAADATLGNVIGSRQILALPLEARNAAGLMSLQPGVVFLPTGDPRSGAVSGARSDQSNVTLDGVDVNDPEYGDRVHDGVADAA